MCKDVALYRLDSLFYFGLVFGFAWSCRFNSHGKVSRQGCITFVDDDTVLFVMEDNRRFEIVRYHHLRGSSEKRIGQHMGVDKVFLLLRRGDMHKGIATRTQYGNKDLRFAYGTVLWVMDGNVTPL